MDQTAISGTARGTASRIPNYQTPLPADDPTRLLQFGGLQNIPLPDDEMADAQEANPDEQEEEPHAPDSALDLQLLGQTVKDLVSDNIRTQKDLQSLRDSNDSLTIQIEQMPHQWEQGLNENKEQLEELRTVSNKNHTEVMAALGKRAAAADPSPPPAPYAKAAIDEALREANRVRSLRQWGIAWYNHPEVKKYHPDLIYEDQAFMAVLKEVREKGTPAIGTHTGPAENPAITAGMHPTTAQPNQMTAAGSAPLPGTATTHILRVPQLLRVHQPFLLLMQATLLE